MTEFHPKKLSNFLYLSKKEKFSKHLFSNKVSIHKRKVFVSILERNYPNFCRNHPHFLHHPSESRPKTYSHSQSPSLRMNQPQLRFSSSTAMSSSSTSHFHNQQYFIISVFDPVTQKSMSLDQAVHLGLFNHMNSVYTHPQTGEMIQLHDAVRRGFVDAQIFEDQVPFICLNTHYIF